MNPKHGAEFWKPVQVQGLLELHAVLVLHKFSITFPHTTQPLLHRSPTTGSSGSPISAAERGSDFGEVTLRPTLSCPGARGPRLTPSPKADPEPRASTGPRRPQGGHRKPAEHFQLPGPAGRATRSLRALILSLGGCRLGLGHTTPELGKVVHSQATSLRKPKKVGDPAESTARWPGQQGVYWNLRAGPQRGGARERSPAAAGG